MSSGRILVALAAAGGFCSWLAAQAGPVELPAVAVLSPRVANQEPSGTIGMPVSGLRFEPQVDVQARNFAEGQADVSIRGGTFANTGFRLSALPLYDPQTGHYSAELPVAPELLTAPSVATGAAHARTAWNASVGSIAYTWRPVRSGGHLAAGVGDYDSYRGEVHVGATHSAGWGADVAVAHSASDGSRPYGDHTFSRYNLRLQHRTEDGAAQTDLFAGHQTKFFGWPNLYTPFNSPETEDIETTLYAVTHRRAWGDDDGFLEFGAYHRRNRDNYAFNRFAPVGPVPPFLHTTAVTGAGLTGRWVRSAAWAVDFRLGSFADEIESTSLLFGRFNSRTYVSAGVFPEWTHTLAGEREVSVSAGLGFDDTNRDEAAVTPVFEVAYVDPSASWHRWSLSYAQSTQVADYTALNANPNAGLFRGNAALGRATSHSLEAAGEFAAGGWRGSAAVFVRRDDELVDWTFQQGVVARLASAVDIDTYGFEVFATREFGRLELLLGYAWLEKDADYGGAVVDGSFYALNFPEHRLTAGLILQLGEGWELRMDNEARLQADNPLRQNGEDEALISALGLYWRVPDVPGLQLSVQVDNLWNSQFEEVPAVPAAQRLVMFGARWQW